MTFLKKGFLGMIILLGILILQPEGHGEWPSGRIPPHGRKKFGATGFSPWGSTLAYASGQLPMFSPSLINKPAPDFTLENLSGQNVNFTGFRQGQKAIIFFWATWCPHCREQLPEINRQIQAMENKGIKIILIDVQEERSEVQGYATRNAINTQILLDKDSSVAHRYGLIGVPTFFFVNSQGIVKAMRNSFPMDYEQMIGP